MTTPHIRSDGIMEDFCDGQYSKQHPVFKDHPNALQFIIYYDDIEVANPLGAKSGTHKIGKSIYKQLIYSNQSRLLLLHTRKYAASFSVFNYCHTSHSCGKNKRY